MAVELRILCVVLELSTKADVRINQYRLGAVVGRVISTGAPHEPIVNKICECGGVDSNRT